MNPCTNSFFPRTALVCLTFLAAILVFWPRDVNAQRRPQRVDPYQNISFKATRPCPIQSSGEVTALVKNGVELSVNEDWDCDGIADAYDNCVGMVNPSQIDSDGNGIGDVCEAATIVRAGRPVKGRSKVNAKAGKAKAVTRRSRSSVGERRSRSGRNRLTKPNNRSRKAAAKPRTKNRRTKHRA